MKTAIPDILGTLGESEYTVLTSTYCKLQQLREQINAIHDRYLGDGVPPSFPKIKAVHLLVEELFGEVEEYVLALSDPTESVCELSRKAA
jgi:hypothetical protein